MVLATGGESGRGCKIRLTKSSCVIYLVYGYFVQRNECPNVEGVSSRSRSDAPSQRGCVANWSNGYGKQQMSIPTPLPGPNALGPVPNDGMEARKGRASGAPNPLD